MGRFAQLSIINCLGFCVQKYFGILVWLPFRPPKGCVTVIAAGLAAATFPEQTGFRTGVYAAGKEFVFFNYQWGASLNYLYQLIGGSERM